MAEILCEERVVEYTKEFKVKVVELTDGLVKRVFNNLLYPGRPGH